MTRFDLAAALNFFRELCAILALLLFFAGAGTWIGYLT